jgi:hypothetical protein
VASERRTVTVEQTKTVYSCDRCGKELPETRAYSSKKFEGVEVYAVRYDAQGRPKHVFELYNNPLLCDPCVGDLLKWLSREPLA